MTRTDATFQSYQNLIAVSPTLGRILPLTEAVTDISDNTLFHAGPPFANISKIPEPMRNSIAAAALHEGWIEDKQDLDYALRSSAIRLQAAQDIGLVTPLAFVVGPSAYCLEVYDAASPGNRKFSPLNDGPMPDALRFGTCRDGGRRLLTKLTDEIGPEYAERARVGTPLLPLIDYGLENGDDLHGHVAATQSKIITLFDDGLSDDATTYMEDANQFVLNVIMATSALMIGGGAGLADSQLVVAAGGNGVDFGYKLASSPDEWIVKPANPPIGPKFPGHDGSVALPAVGDSAVVDALGFGAACLRLCPTLESAFGSYISPEFLKESAHNSYVGPHPSITNQTVNVGLDMAASKSCLGITLGMVGADGTQGLIGRGVASWPDG